MMVEILEADVYEVLDLDLYSIDEHAALCIVSTLYIIFYY